MATGLAKAPHEPVKQAVPPIAIPGRGLERC